VVVAGEAKNPHVRCLLVRNHSGHLSFGLHEASALHSAVTTFSSSPFARTTLRN
jgi:hypothetical protein